MFRILQQIHTHLSFACLIAFVVDILYEYSKVKTKIKKITKKKLLFCKHSMASLWISTQLSFSFMKNKIKIQIKPKTNKIINELMTINVFIIFVSLREYGRENNIYFAARPYDNWLTVLLRIINICLQHIALITV